MEATDSKYAEDGGEREGEEMKSDFDAVRGRKGEGEIEGDRVGERGRM